MIVILTVVGNHVHSYVTPCLLLNYMSLSSPSGALSFDFRTYLERLTGINKWEIEDLVGGAANLTVRARPMSTRASPDDSESTNGAVKLDLKSFDSGLSVVIKQAPDCLAKFPEIPFSPYRQVGTPPSFRSNFLTRRYIFPRL